MILYLGQASFQSRVASRCAVTGRESRGNSTHMADSVPRNVAGESLCGSAETRPGLVPCDEDGTTSRTFLMEGWKRDETGSHYAVKGDVDACDRSARGAGSPIRQMLQRTEGGLRPTRHPHTMSGDPDRPPGGSEDFIKEKFERKKRFRHRGRKGDRAHALCLRNKCQMESPGNGVW